MKDEFGRIVEDYKEGDLILLYRDFENRDVIRRIAKVRKGVLQLEYGALIATSNSSIKAKY